MLSYFAMIWDRTCETAAGRARKVRHKILTSGSMATPVFSDAGMAVYDLGTAPDTDRTVLIRTEGPDPDGVIYGAIFPRSETQQTVRALRDIDRLTARDICRSRGRRLVTDFWGSYVSFLNTGEEVVFIADPTGAIPAFFMQKDGVTFVFSHLEGCPFIDTRELSVNRTFILRLIAYDKIQTGETGLSDVHELAGGERLQVRGPVTSQDRVWDPVDIALCTEAPEPEAAGEALAWYVRQGVRSRANCFSHVTVSLSGGLDSSIVLSALADRDQTTGVSALHILLQSGDRPELGYARMMAAHAGCRLIEGTLSPQYDLPEVTDHPLSVRPWRQFLAFDFDTLTGAGSVGKVVFTGQGGDHLFLETRTPLGFADYLRHNGPGPGSFSALKDAASLSGLSWPDVVLKSLPGALSLPRTSSAIRSMQNRQTGMNRQATSDLELSASLPAWARQLRRLPPAKSDQVATLPHMFQIRDPLEPAGGRVRVHPLISQPLIELCLKYPVWLLTTGGVSRGLARSAFRNVLPEEIRLRTSKGEASGFYALQVKHNRARLIEALSRGSLVSMGLLDPAALKTFMDRAGPDTDPNSRMLLQYYTIEAWLRRWESSPRSDLNGLA